MHLKDCLWPNQHQSNHIFLLPTTILTKGHDVCTVCVHTDNLTACVLVNIMKDHFFEIKESIKTPDIFQRASDTITKWDTGLLFYCARQWSRYDVRGGGLLGWYITPLGLTTMKILNCKSKKYKCNNIATDHTERTAKCFLHCVLLSLWVYSYTHKVSTDLYNS